MNNLFSTWLMVAYGMSILGYVGRFIEGIPNVGILIGMTIISTAYAFMFLSKLYKKLEPKKETLEEKKAEIQRNWGKIFTIVGYALASIFFFAIHFIPQLTFTVRYYDIFGAVGYGVTALGTSLLSTSLLPIGYAITALYYVCGSYQKLGESEWIGRLQLISRTILAVMYGATSLSLTNM